MNMTSNFDVTNSAQQIQMTTIWQWMKHPHENFLRTPLSSTKSSVKIKWLISQLRTVKPSLTSRWLSTQCTYEKEWWQHTPLSESKIKDERSWFNSPDTDTNFWAGMQWLDPKTSKALVSPKLFTRNPVACFLQEIGKARVDIFATLPRFHKNLLESENLVCNATTGMKTASGIIQFWFNYFAASFFKAFGNVNVNYLKIPKKHRGPRVWDPCSSLWWAFQQEPKRRDYVPEMDTNLELKLSSNHHVFKSSSDPIHPQPALSQVLDDVESSSGSRWMFHFSESRYFESLNFKQGKVINAEDWAWNVEPFQSFACWLKSVRFEKSGLSWITAFSLKLPFLESNENTTRVESLAQVTSLWRAT